MKQLRILLWFLVRPHYYHYFLYFVSWRLRNLRHSPNTLKDRERAQQWCEQMAVGRDAALQQVIGTIEFPSFDEQFKPVLDVGEAAVRKVSLPLGGAGDMELLYQIAEHLQATAVIETGVAFGWSSLALLLSLQHRPASRLVSTDLPFPSGKSQQYVGMVVPEHLKACWTIIPYPDQQAIPRALKLLRQIDLCHYDSDKTYEGRQWAYPRLWAALRQGGVFISDDVQDNLGFHDFCQQIQRKPLIYKYKNKFIGILVKHEPSL
jgi:hypothetical protein